MRRGGAMTPPPWAGWGGERTVCAQGSWGPPHLPAVSALTRGSGVDRWVLPGAAAPAWEKSIFTLRVGKCVLTTLLARRRRLASARPSRSPSLQFLRQREAR